MAVHRGRRFGFYVVGVTFILFLSYCNPIPWQKLGHFRHPLQASLHSYSSKRPSKHSPAYEDLEVYKWPEPNTATFPDQMVGAEEFDDALDNTITNPAMPPESSDAPFRHVTSGNTVKLTSDLRLKDKLAAVDELLQSKGGPPIGHNRNALRELTHCIYEEKCVHKPQLVIVVSDVYYKAYLLKPSGLPSPPHTVLAAFDRLNVSYVFSPKDIGWARNVHMAFPDQVKLVLFDRSDLRSCLDVTSSCVRTVQNPTGIPAFKMFTWENEATEEAVSPFGYPWTLTARQAYAGESFVGFSIPDSCRKEVPYVPPADRFDRVWILATVETFFWKTHNVFPPEYFEKLGDETKVRFFTQLHPTEGRLKDYPQLSDTHTVPKNLVDVGQQTHLDSVDEGENDFEARALEYMSKSRLLLGLWDPRFELTVLQALCVGVPFLNPIHQWDASNATNRELWVTQNPELNVLDPPYVYHVFPHDYAAFKKAILDAMETPIASYIPPHLTEAALTKRLSELLERDWKAEAEKVATTEASQDFLF
ncbi:hypothetical protein MIND_00864600 [Mycena indigotica]|uniref:Uncharacterized protein n=1 Tax=Mycena indigotica TaxID=2126181 RepID=A0A8H6SI20_9AGAR|nr:uncharacterized protein MIND_00864600 [Mycena indigotica]KAF7299160.1 hypothetical protein MIND_00864600 [Mycena indigotica]